MDYSLQQGRLLRPRGTRVIYDQDGSDAGSDAESSDDGHRSSREAEGGSNSRRGHVQSRYFGDEQDEDASEDEWRPESGSKKRKRAVKGRRGNSAARSASSSEDEPLSAEEGLEEDEIVQGAASARAKDKGTGKRTKKNGALVQRGESLSAGAAAAQRHRLQQRHAPGHQANEVNGDRAKYKPRGERQATSIEPSTIVDLAPPSPEEDGVDAQAEADRLWKDVRARKAGAAPAAQPASKGSGNTVNKAPGGLDNWLGVEPPAWPTTCADAMINDRDSLFVGFVYALQSSSQSEITRCLSHLTKVVQPQAVPQGRLPPGMQHLAPTRRGATHDMFAWRTLALKRGRTGLGGPEDFGLEEGQEDDGEKFGAKEISKVIRMYGATDVLVVVSRWYGGTMLGPVRFRHIEESAKAALGQHMVNEAMADLLAELRQLDKDIADVRAQKAGSSMSQPPSSAEPRATATYTDLDPDRAQRLITARKKQLEMLKKTLDAGAQTVTSAGTEHRVEADAEATLDLALDNAFDEAEEAAALEAIAAAEAAVEAEARQAAPASEAPENVTVKSEPQEHVPSEPSPVPYIKPDPDAPREPSPEPNLAADEQPMTPRVKPEPAEHNVLSPPRPPAQPAEPRVKLEQPEDDTDLTGWDELS